NGELAWPRDIPKGARAAHIRAPARLSEAGARSGESGNRRASRWALVKRGAEARRGILSLPRRSLARSAAPLSIPTTIRQERATSRADYLPLPRLTQHAAPGAAVLSAHAAGSGSYSARSTAHTPARTRRSSRPPRRSMPRTG